VGGDGALNLVLDLKRRIFPLAELLRYIIIFSRDFGAATWLSRLNQAGGEPKIKQCPRGYERIETEIASRLFRPSTTRIETVAPSASVGKPDRSTTVMWRKTSLPPSSV